MHVQPYLFFQGRCEEALDYYQKVLGAEVTMLMRFEDAPEPPPPGVLAPGSERKIMHASFRVGDSEIMASDGDCKGGVHPQGFSLSLSVPTPQEAQRLFAALAEGSQVQMPIGPTFFSPMFGMLTDRFGVGWMVVAEPAA
ncbi:MAG TPA: VOC family protein [Burkholderiaceae bacterium]|nr:VOC family protein [Burkholderiaceae bacterium]